MKPNKANNSNVNTTLSDMDILCSSGYLAPRTEADLERFDCIYATRVYKTEQHCVEANAIFDKVVHEMHKNQKETMVANIFPTSYNYLVASGIEEDDTAFCAEDIMDLLKKK